MNGNTHAHSVKTMLQKGAKMNETQTVFTVLDNLGQGQEDMTDKTKYQRLDTGERERALDYRTGRIVIVNDLCPRVETYTTSVL